MVDCACCGTHIVGTVGDKCDSCATGACDPSVTWHCFTGHCDGSGCTFPGECEGARQVHYQALSDGQKFSADGGSTWHVCAVPLFGNVAVYVNARRDENAPTVRVDVPESGMVLVR